MVKVDLRSRNGFEQGTALLLIALGILFRVLPHPGNFTPTAAIALFSGVVLPPSLAFTVPLLVMAASDLWIGPHALFWLVWLTFALVTWIGQRVRGGAGWMPLALGTFAGSVLFFVVSNLGVFFFENMYPRTLDGLVQCFTMALPFFRNSLAADLFYTAIFFLLYSLARHASRTPAHGRTS